MSNLLANASLWLDGDGNQPPACWDGTSYVVTNSQAALTLTGYSPVNGDTLEASISCALSGIQSTAQLVYGTPPGTALPTTGDLTQVVATETPTDYVWDIPQDGTAPFTLYLSPGNGCSSDTLTITPPIPPPPPPPPIPDCGELGRVTRSFVSGYTAARTETRRIRRFSKRCVVANFNGAMEAGRTITHVRWDCTSPWSIHISNPRVESSGRTVAVDAAFNFAGWGGLMATAHWDNGEVTNQEFFFTVLDRPLYPSANYTNANGPYVLEADA